MALAAEMDVPLQAVLAEGDGCREGQGMAASAVGRVMAAAAGLVVLSGLDGLTLVKPANQQVEALRERFTSQIHRVPKGRAG